MKLATFVSRRLHCYAIAVVVTLSFGVVASDVLSQPSFTYHSHFQTFMALKRLHNAYPDITRLSQIGSSTNGLALTVLEITDNPGQHELLEPEFKYVGNIHGNEPVGKELLLHFAYYICSRYGQERNITRLVNSTRIHLLFNMNPDGFAAAQEGVCYGTTGRYNAAKVDLNRNFPDPIDARSSAVQPETLAVMSWLRNISFVLSASFHGGAMVANYPYDNLPLNLRPPGEKQDYYTGIYSPSADDDVFRHLAQSYASKHLTMHKGDVCEGETFKNGITNGADWYTLRGGMQDFNYIYTNCFELTLEVSCCKFPNGSQLNQYWTDNRAAMLDYVTLVHMGVKGLVVDGQSKQPVPIALIHVTGRDKAIRVSDLGEFWRLLLPGNYTLTASAFGYANQTKPVTIEQNNTAILHFELEQSVYGTSSATAIFHSMTFQMTCFLSFALVMGMTRF